MNPETRTVPEPFQAASRDLDDEQLTEFLMEDFMFWPDKKEDAEQTNAVIEALLRRPFFNPDWLNELAAGVCYSHDSAEQTLALVLAHPDADPTTALSLLERSGEDHDKVPLETIAVRFPYTQAAWSLLSTTRLRRGWRVGTPEFFRETYVKLEKALPGERACTAVSSLARGWTHTLDELVAATRGVIAD